MRQDPRRMTRIALFTALHVAAAVTLRLGGEAAVPFSLVPLFVLMAGLLLGRDGALSLLVYALLGLAGVPVFAKPPFGGLAYLLQPSFGYVIGYILAAYVIGWLVERRALRSALQFFLAATLGLAVLYLVGLPYLYLVLRFVLEKTLSWRQVLAVGLMPFIALDLLKAGIAAWLAAMIRPRLQARRAN